VSVGFSYAFDCLDLPENEIFQGRFVLDLRLGNNVGQTPPRMRGFHSGNFGNFGGHADPRTTRLYDRRDKKITRNIVERISI